MPKVAYVVYNLQIRTTAYLQVMPPTLCRIGLMPCLPQPTRLAISSATTFAGILKRNGNYSRCFDKPKPPATKELAIQRYASEYPPATICAPLKLNSPFQCTRNVEVPATTRLSLSVAAAQAVFAVAGIILVALLRKLRTPPKSTESLSGDDDIRSVVRKLRITVDKLDSKVDQLGTEFRTGQDKLSSGHGEHEELIQKLLSK